MILFSVNNFQKKTVTVKKTKILKNVTIRHGILSIKIPFDHEIFKTNPEFNPGATILFSTFYYNISVCKTYSLKEVKGEYWQLIANSVP